MISNEEGAKLHSKHTEGGKLSEAELSSLQEWYDFMDKQEAKILGVDIEEEPESQSKVEELLEQIKISNQRYKEILSENEKLKAEADALRQKIAQLYDKRRA